jgi:hypothetical protein
MKIRLFFEKRPINTGLLLFISENEFFICMVTFFLQVKDHSYIFSLKNTKHADQVPICTSKLHI